MKVSRLSRAGVCAAVLSLASLTYAEDVALSGTVHDKDDKPLPGVTVSLALAKTSTTTDAEGAWSLVGASVGIASRNAVLLANRPLVLEDGRLSVRFEGRDAAGRGLGRSAAAARSGVAVARAADVPDTLLYSWNGKVRLRDTISASRTGIVRTLDTTVNPSIVHGYLTDVRDGQTYRTVKIVSQVWMAQNLNFATDSSWVYKCQSWDGASCSKDSVAMGKKHGRLYKWAAAMGLRDSCSIKACSSQVAAKHQGACPSGWHVPSNAEWTVLIRETSANILKATSGWSSRNGIDDYGFMLLPAGNRGNNGSFSRFGTNGDFWSATESSGSDAWYRGYGSAFDYALTDRSNKSDGYSLRCLQD